MILYLFCMDLSFFIKYINLHLKKVIIIVYIIIIIQVHFFILIKLNLKTSLNEKKKIYINRRRFVRTC
jgi:hypothetical protein